MRKNESDAIKLADAVRARILERTGIKRQELQCPREKSAMTPCIARDGGLAVAITDLGVPLCVGCEIGLDKLREMEGLPLE